MAPQQTKLEELDRWQRQIAARDWDRAPQNPAGRLAIGTLARRRTACGLIDVRHLVLTLLHYETDREGTPSVILRGFAGAPVPWGVKWGGPEHSRFEKDLSLAPTGTARGRRLNWHQQKLLPLALELDRRLWRTVTGEDTTSLGARIRLPNLWAAFTPKTAVRGFGDGPELETLCRKRRQKPARMLEQFRRSHQGLVLLPLNWVSHHWEVIVRVFADRTRFPKCHVVQGGGDPADLQGYWGACEYDFRQTRFAEPQTAHGQPKPLVSANASIPRNRVL